MVEMQNLRTMGFSGFDLWFRARNVRVRIHFKREVGSTRTVVLAD